MNFPQHPLPASFNYKAHFSSLDELVAAFVHVAEWLAPGRAVQIKRAAEALKNSDKTEQIVPTTRPGTMLVDAFVAATADAETGAYRLHAYKVEARVLAAEVAEDRGAE
ncbi:hypothetical protein [Roseateles albus]|uniref:Uncharacterized protein n=1 Tax=Roseateles albus TaxID=2987525 RepID=A0ABT5KCV8_9BURK|nr:hypothetical protein [Roseateles albus]MDC8771755.1 hypothetical protein [Roseateles albus]